ncbi:MAG: YdjY domain-containing protein [Planctomycetota bacterium]
MKTTLRRSSAALLPVLFATVLPVLFATLLPVLFATPAPAQQEKDPEAAQAGAQQGADLAAAMRAQFDQEKVRVDLDAGTVTVPAVAIEPPDPIEYALIHRRGKKHEAMFFTESKPSVLNAALLLLGLEPGRNATYREKDPPPTLQEIENGADPVIVTPPEGTPFWITVKWTGADGKVEQHCIEDLIGDLTTQEAVQDASWIYLGGRMARLYKDDPEVFVADFEGNLVSVCYLSPDNHLGTMRHERARDDQNWWLTRLMPPVGTEVEFVFHRRPGPLHAARAERLKKAAAGEGEGGSKDAEPAEPGAPRGGGN